jgi:membrane protease YdiL (CAAX protease family)
MTASDSSVQRDFDILKAMALVLLFAAWNAFSDVLYGHLHLDGAPRTAPLRVGMFLVGTLVTCGGIVWLGCMVWARRSLSALGWTARHPARLLLLGLLLTALLFAGVFSFVAWLGGMDRVRAFAAAITGMTASERMFFTIAGAKVAFAEETLFRGLLLPALARRTGVLVAVVLSSVIFGLYHRSLLPIPFLLVKMALGSLLAVFTLASRSLVPSWLGHSLLWAIAGDN